jgi:hypothetical protein
MNLKSVSDSELLLATKRLASEEKRIGIEVLHHLREIDARKLFASLRFSSLYEYCTEELGYSGGGAHRRISAMKILRDVPEYEPKLRAGVVNVATLSKVQSFLVREKRQLGKTYSKDEKTELLEQIERKSVKETDRILAAISPEQARIEKERVLNENESEVRFTVNRELKKKLERLRNLLGHKSKTQSYAGLIEELADIAIKKLDPLEKAPAHKTPSPPVEMHSSHTRYVRAEVKRSVWRRDTGQCTYVDSNTNRRCESQHSLQIEHIKPFALGGSSTLENLKLLCPAHNQRAAIQAFGLSKMQGFWSK